MTTLTVFWPDEAAIGDDFEGADGGLSSHCIPEPWVIPFGEGVARVYALRRQGSPTVQRARLLHENRCCIHCGCPRVEPILLDDGEFDQALRIVPGTATLVGFRCETCDESWDVEPNRVSC